MTAIRNDLYEDACPACLAHARTVTASPFFVTEDGDWSLLALYRCPGCGHQWRCWWDAISLSRRPEAGAA